MPAVQFSPPAQGQDFGAMFDADWSQAQQRYQKGLSSGYSEDDAKKLYLDPVRAKWNVIRSAPSAFASNQNLDKINADFENGQISAVKNLSRSEPTTATIDRHISPLIEKWQVVSSMPQSEPRTAAQTRDWYAKNPAMQAEETEATKQIESGMPARDVLSAHPTLIQNQPYSSRWQPLWKSGMLKQQSDEERAARPMNESAINRLVLTRKRLSDGLIDKTIPEETRSAYQFQINKIDSLLKSNEPQPPMDADGPQRLDSIGDGSGAVRFNPPPQDSGEPDQSAESSPQNTPTVPTSRPPVETRKSELPMIGNQSEYDALQSGEQYYDAQGNLRRKK